MPQAVKPKTPATQSTYPKTSQPLKREEEERQIAAKEHEERLRSEAEKAEQERPIRDRIERIAVNLQCIHVPDGAAMKKVKAVLSRAAEQIRKIAAGPLGEE